MGEGSADEFGTGVGAWLRAFSTCGTDVVTPVLAADDPGRTSPGCLDVFAAPGLDQVVMMLTAQLFVDVIAHGWFCSPVNLGGSRTRQLEEITRQKAFKRVR